MGGNESVQVAEVIGENIVHDRDVDLRVTVDEDVTKPCHVGDAVREFRADPPASSKPVEQLAACCRFAEALFRDDMGSDVERGLDGEL